MTTGDDGSTPPNDPSVWWAGWRVGSFRPGLWTLTWIGWSTFFIFPLISGLLFKLVFDALESDEAITGLLVAIGLTELGRFVVFAFSIWVVVRWWVAASTMQRTNMLRAQTVSGGPHRGALPSGPAEAISRFHEDTRDMNLWADAWLDGFGYMSAAVAAIVIMARIDVQASLVVLIPLTLVTAAIGWIRPRLYRAAKADREAAGAVAGFLGETFAGILAFRLAGREAVVIHRLERHTDLRRTTAVRHVMLEQSIDGFTSTTSDISVGLILLVLVPGVRRGDISVGDLALFVSYSMMLGEAPRYLSRLVSAREQARVALARLTELVAPERPTDLFERCEVTVEPRGAMRRREPDPDRVPIDRLRVRGLTAVYGSTGAGVHDIDLDIGRGEFVVITGQVGSGKSTLLRALVGLVPAQAGQVWWNGHEVEDLGAWFVPPMAAHLPQVPRLFSESLTSNITLGRATDAVDEVVAATALGPDLLDMPDGLETRVGARGLRLSGGQAQRVATARSLLPAPELLVVDDLSSALDVETERALWSHVRTRGTTVLAVSHRRFVLDMADQVITVVGGPLATDKAGLAS